uniref:Uncharacterized protein n=1 Tax=Oryza glumipatula TaxID=40148 RepID=A0A0D9Y3M5_9ORYZ
MYTKCGVGAAVSSSGCPRAVVEGLRRRRRRRLRAPPHVVLSPASSHSECSANSLSHPHRRLYTEIPNHRHRNGGTRTGLRR